MASSSEHRSKPSGKKAYETPKLTQYGALKDLTTGGTGQAQEGSSGQRPRP